ncbi:protein FAM174C [Genypterus blacodes]|uniref:protein FAM174C n=1 Tax=Genypterus blacodes TaxID=154954 RepID=UPI003F762F07
MKMSPRRLFVAVLLPWCWFVAAVTDDVTVRPASANSSLTNSTSNRRYQDLFDVDSSMIQRALYVLIGITMIGVLYFLIRAVRLKKPVQRKKYGLLSNYEDSVELEAEDSEEDNTLYEARSLRR